MFNLYTGTTWGDNGYVYICRDCNKNGDNGECDILNYPPVYPVASSQSSQR